MSGTGSATMCETDKQRPGSSKVNHHVHRVSVGIFLRHEKQQQSFGAKASRTLRGSILATSLTATSPHPKTMQTVSKNERIITNMHHCVKEETTNQLGPINHQHSTTEPLTTKSRHMSTVVNQGSGHPVLFDTNGQQLTTRCCATQATPRQSPRPRRTQRWSRPK